MVGMLEFIVVFFSIFCMNLILIQFSSVQSLSRVRLFATPWIAARQASLSITNSWSSLKLMSIESVIHAKVVSKCWTVPNALSILIVEIIMWAFNFSLCAKWITLSYWFLILYLSCCLILRYFVNMLFIWL